MFSTRNSPQHLVRPGRRSCCAAAPTTASATACRSARTTLPAHQPRERLRRRRMRRSTNLARRCSSRCSCRCSATKYIGSGVTAAEVQAIFGAGGNGNSDTMFRDADQPGVRQRRDRNRGDAVRYVDAERPDLQQHRTDPPASSTRRPISARSRTPTTRYKGWTCNSGTASRHRQQRDSASLPTS